MFGLIKGLFRGKSETTMSDDPFGRNPAPSSAAPSVPAPVVPPKKAPGLSVFRQEMIGQGARLVGYQFSVRSHGGTSPSTADCVDALLADNLVDFAQRRIALVPVELTSSLQESFDRLVAPQSIFYVRSSDLGLGTPDWLDALSKLKGREAKVAISMLTASNHSMLLGLIDLLVIDIKDYSLEGFERQVRAMRASHPQIPIVVDGVSSWAEHRLCQDLGAAYSMGEFAAHPDEEKQGQKLNQSRLVMIEMLNLLRTEAEGAELVAVAKRDPGVALKIVEMANSPMAGLSAPVASIQQALIVLGRETLYRWIALGVYRAGNSGHDETLLEFALCRARFLELVGHAHGTKTKSDELFLVGMLSLLDSLLGMPMDKAIEKMTLPDVVRNVLLNSEGPYGRYLMLALAVEKGRIEQVVNLAQSLHLEMEDVETARSEAQQWTEHALLAH